MVIVRKRGSTGWPSVANVRGSTLLSGAVNDSRPESTSCAMQTAVIAFDRLGDPGRRCGGHPAGAERRHQVAVFHDGDAGGRDSDDCDIHSRNDAIEGRRRRVAGNLRFRRRTEQRPS